MCSIIVQLINKSSETLYYHGADSQHSISLFYYFIILFYDINFSAFCFQKPPCGRKCVCCGAGQSGGLPGVPAAAPGLFQGHLGLPVLPGHCKLPVLFTEGTVALDFRSEMDSISLCIYLILILFSVTHAFSWTGNV